jgi:outer membrane immunogenic protein
MKKIVAASLLFLSPAVALAADPPGKKPAPAPAPVAQATQWGGFYVGANLGGGFGKIGDNGLPVDRKGAIGGLQAGYALQSGSLVYGVEADANLSSISGSKAYSATYTLSNGQATETGTIKANLTSIGTFRTRVGYAFDNFLVYGTAGAATSRQTVKITAKQVVGTQTNYLSESQSEWVRGWTLGLGSEYELSRNVSLKLEYLHVHFNTTATNQASIVRTGVNYRF